jgi:predicted lipoprotein with Yx(FWY)xxD motif
MLSKKVVLAPVAALALAIAGVAAAAAVTNPQAFRTLAASSSSGTVTLHKTKLGKVLATRGGMTLYLFKKDKGGKSSCYGQCAAYWPPLMKKGKVTAGTGLKAKLLGTTKRRNGTRQVTYGGHPLYGFKLDKHAGEVEGQGEDFFGGKWFAVSGAGRAVTKTVTTTTTTDDTTTTAPTTTCAYGGC